MRNLWLFVVAIALIFSGCSPVTIRGDWKDPTYSEMPKKIFVVVLLKNETKRRFIEDQFVQQFKQHGVEAVSSFTVFEKGLPEDLEVMRSKLAELGADSVLISKVVDKRTETVQVPGEVYTTMEGRHMGWEGYYRSSYNRVYFVPGYTVSQEYAVAESKLYDVKDVAMVWSIVTETSLEDNNFDLLGKYVSTLVGAMKKNDLIP